MDLSTKHFRNLWKSVNEDFDGNCQKWESVCKEDTVPEDVLGEMRAVMGLAKLLQAQKLKQFWSLIDDCEFGTGEKEISLADLQGFWDMVHCEVEKIKKGFKKLEDCKRNAWKLAEESVEKVLPKKGVKNVPPKKMDKSSEHAEAARQRLAEIKKRMKAAQQQIEKEPEKSSPLSDALITDTKPSDENKETSDENGPELIAPVLSKKPNSKGRMKAQPEKENVEEKATELGDGLKMKTEPSQDQNEISNENGLKPDAFGPSKKPNSKKRIKAHQQEEDIQEKATELGDGQKMETEPSQDQNEISDENGLKLDAPGPNKIAKKPNSKKRTKVQQQKANIPEKATEFDDGQRMETEPLKDHSEMSDEDEAKLDAPGPSERITKKPNSKKRIKAQQQEANIPEKARFDDGQKMETEPLQDHSETSDENEANLDAPSPSKIAKKQNSKVLPEDKLAKKTTRSKPIPKKGAINKSEKTGAIQKTALSKQEKENTPLNVKAASDKKLKQNKNRHTKEVSEDYEKPITRSARKAMMVQQKAAQKS